MATVERREGAQGARAVDWVTWRRLAVGGFLAIFATYIAAFGIPLDRVGITLWVLAGLSATVVGKGWAAWRKLMLDWLPFEGLLLVYDFSRGYAGQYGGPGEVAPVDGQHNIIGMPLHTKWPVEADRFLFGGTLPNQWLQEHLHHATGHGWYTVLFSLSYLSHFLVTPLVAVVLWIVARDRFRAWIYCVLGLTVVGLATYFLFPMAPPWLASQQGYIRGAPVGRYAGEGWQLLGFNFASRAVAVGQAKANLVAAMPSLHEAFSVLAAGFFCVGARWWVRILLVCYPLLMAVSLVYAGEHYVIDELVGAFFAVCTLVAWRVLHHLRARRSSAREVPHREDLLGAADGSVHVVQHGRGQTDAIRAEGDPHVEPHPGGVGRAHQVDRQVDIGEHQLGGSHPGGTAVGGVDQHHE